METADRLVPGPVHAERAPRLLVAKDIPEGISRYLCDELGLSLTDDTFFILSRSPSADERRFFGFHEQATPYMLELTRTTRVNSDDGPRPLYAAVGVFAGDRNRFEFFRGRGHGRT